MEMKVGDFVEVSDRNTNHLGHGVCAYAGMKGRVVEVWDDNSFAIDCGTSSLVVPLVIFGKPTTCLVWHNNELVCIRGKVAHSKKTASISGRMHLSDKIVIGILFFCGLIVLLSIFFS